MTDEQLSTDVLDLVGQQFFNLIDLCIDGGIIGNIILFTLSVIFWMPFCFLLNSTLTKK